MDFRTYAHVDYFIGDVRGKRSHKTQWFLKGSDGDKELKNIHNF